MTVATPARLTTIAAKIVQQFPDTRPILKSEILRTYDSIFDWRGGMMIVMLSVAVLSFIIFAWDKATGLSAEERKEIGILKSIGWETADVLLLKFWEGTVISLSAFLCRGDPGLRAMSSSSPPRSSNRPSRGGRFSTRSSG